MPSLLCEKHSPWQEELLDAIHWMRQVLAIVVGVIFGLIPMKGLNAILMCAHGPPLSGYASPAVSLTAPCGATQNPNPRPGQSLFVLKHHAPVVSLIHAVDLLLRLSGVIELLSQVLIHESGRCLHLVSGAALG